MINGSFVFGMDDDDETVFDRTVQWAIEEGIETATFHILTPYPSTALYQRMEAGTLAFSDTSRPLPSEFAQLELFTKSISEDVCGLRRGWVAGGNGTLLETNDGGQAWRKLFPPTKDTIRDIHFASDRIGWLVCERDAFKVQTNDEPRSYLLKTGDGGSSWHTVSFKDSEINARLVRAVFADAQRGWVFGETGVVFATRDGGASWTRQALPTKHLLLGGAFVDQAHGWLVGAGTAPVVIGYIAQRASLSYAISIASLALVGASILLAIAMVFTAGRDVERLRRQLQHSET